jgi:SMC interacting uncharacterized protein involved in chromosome segregation
MANIHNFMIENGIYDISAVADKDGQMYNRSRKLADNMKKIDRRLDTLATHLAQYEIYKKHKQIARKFNELKGKSQNEFHEKHNKEIQAYKAATDYLKKVMNGKTPIPVKAWEAEQKKLTSDRWSLCDEYYDLRGEIKTVESLRRSAERVLQYIEIENPKKRTLDYSR